MLRQWWLIFGLLLIAPAAAAPAQGIAQPNHGADVTTAESSPATAIPLASTGSISHTPRIATTAPARSSLIITPAPAIAPVTTTLPAIPLDPKEKLPLGVARESTALGGNDKTTETAPSSWMLTTLASLGAVVGLILVLRATISKLTGRAVTSSHSPVVEVLSRTSIAPRNQVVLLRLGRRILVVGDSAAGLHTLADIVDAEEVAGLLQSVAASKPGSSTSGFSGVLEGFDGEYEDEPHGRGMGKDGSEHRVDRARDSVRGLLSRLRHAGKGGEA